MATFHKYADGAVITIPVGTDAVGGRFPVLDYILTSYSESGGAVEGNVIISGTGLTTKTLISGQPTGGANQWDYIFVDFPSGLVITKSDNLSPPTAATTIDVSNGTGFVGAVGWHYSRLRG